MANKRNAGEREGEKEKLGNMARYGRNARILEFIDCNWLVSNLMHASVGILRSPTYIYSTNKRSIKDFGLGEHTICLVRNVFNRIYIFTPLAINSFIFISIEKWWTFYWNFLGSRGQWAEEDVDGSLTRGHASHAPILHHCRSHSHRHMDLPAIRYPASLRWNLGPQVNALLSRLRNKPVFSFFILFSKSVLKSSRNLSRTAVSLSQRFGETKKSLGTAS